MHLAGSRHRHWPRWNMHLCMRWHARQIYWQPVVAQSTQHKRQSLSTHFLHRSLDIQWARRARTERIRNNSRTHILQNGGQRRSDHFSVSVCSLQLHSAQPLSVRTQDKPWQALHSAQQAASSTQLNEISPNAWQWTYNVKRHTHITIIASHHHCTNSLMRQGWQRWRRQSLTNRNDFRAKCIHNHFFPFIIRILWGVAVRIKQHQTPVPFRRECDCTATPTTTAACSTHLHNKRFWWFYDIFGLCHQNHTQLLSLPSIKLDTHNYFCHPESTYTRIPCVPCAADRAIRI